MVFLVVGLQAAQDLDRVLDRGLVDVDLLEPPDQRPVLLEVVAVLLVGGRADAAQAAALQRRLEQVGGVHGAARGGAGADHRVDLVDEQDRPVERLDLRYDRLKPLLEVAPVARAGQQRPHVEAEDGRLAQHLRDLVPDDAPGQAFGDRGLADARVADVERVVLGPPAQHLDGPLDFVDAADQRVDPALARLLVEVDAVGIERLAPLAHDLVGLGILLGAMDGAVLLLAEHLGDAVADVIERIQAAHLLFLQEVDRVALALREHGDQDVGAGHLLAARRLHVDRGALQHALEAGGRLRVAQLRGDQIGQLVVDVVLDLAAQAVEIDPAGPEHRDGVGILDQGQQQVLQRRVLVAPLVGVGQGPVEGLFEIGREHSSAIPFLGCIARDADAALHSLPRN